MGIENIQPGVYSVDYFSGAQCALYVGDIWVDEVTSISYSVSQSRRPLYGYADQLFKDMSKGQVIIQGEFTINFKESGYIWLVLDHYRQRIKGLSSLIPPNPFASSALISQNNIEAIINADGNLSERNELIKSFGFVGPPSPDDITNATSGALESTAASLGGFSSVTRARKDGIGNAENILEQFEDAVWGKNKNGNIDLTQSDLDNANRRADDPALNPFDIYLAYGDFAGDNRVNHTIQKIAGVHIIGSGKQVVIDGQPIQESYQFLARNIV